MPSIAVFSNPVILTGKLLVKVGVLVIALLRCGLIRMTILPLAHRYDHALVCLYRKCNGTKPMVIWQKQITRPQPKPVCTRSVAVSCLAHGSVVMARMIAQFEEAAT